MTFTHLLLTLACLAALSTHGLPLIFPLSPASASSSAEVYTAYRAGDYSKAFTSVHQLAMNGNHWAENFLGVMHENGEGTSPDIQQAIVWYRRAADGLDHNGQYNLGRLYHHGKGLPKDIDSALYWYKMSSQAGHPTAGRVVGHILLASPKESENREAYEWFLVAARKNDPESQHIVGMMNEEWGNFTDGRYWNRQAAERGFALAQYALARMVETPKGGPRNAILSYMWYRIAFDNPQAVPFLDGTMNRSNFDRLRLSFSPDELAEAEKATPRQWRFQKDMNGDGKITIRDVPLWIGWLFYYPGDTVLDYLLYYPAGKLSEFFELNPNHYGGGVSFIISLAFWLLIFVLLIIIMAILDRFSA